jgi:hypothetical protein
MATAQKYMPNSNSNGASVINEDLPNHFYSQEEPAKGLGTMSQS